MLNLRRPGENNASCQSTVQVRFALHVYLFTGFQCFVGMAEVDALLTRVFQTKIRRMMLSH